jgi:eukaryotic-like serine/threonine-protein kinase
MSLWSKFLEAFRAPGDRGAADARAPDPAATISAEEAYLRHLLNRPMPKPEGAQGDVGDREFWAAISRLTTAGRERTAIELLGRFVVARPDDAELAARLVELLCERRDDAAARPLLERLARSPAHAERAHFLLADLDERAGDEPAARRHLEEVLAVDLDHPRARARADKLARPAGAATPALEASTVLSAGGQSTGRYRLVRELGRGASGAVYLARDEELDRALALKILHPQSRGQSSAEARARAWLEARVAASIRHPGVVAIYDLDEERHLVAMELCEGGSLRQKVAPGPLTPLDALERAAELLATLEAVHRRGIAHGDVKPGNLLFRSTALAPFRDLVLVDFGLARLIDDPASSGGGGAGTLAYMAPEQRQGALSPAADVHAAGVILVELLCGTPALAGWLADRAGLLRGEARWDGSWNAAVESSLGAPRAAKLRELAQSMMAPEAARRPTAAEAARTLASL